MAAASVTRSLVTPEGIDLRIALGTAGERASAFLIDVTIIVAALIGVTVLAGVLAIKFAAFSVAGIIWLAGFFVLRNLYFAFFELGARAATPGKRVLGLRVVSQHGGRLTADAVLARNLMRELEVFLPLSLYLWQGGGVDSLLIGAGLLWTGIFTLFPLFNRDRMRVGDLLAGTWVVHAPRRLLMPDLTDASRAPLLSFSRKQVDVYGVRELQLLEEVLRTRDQTTMAAVAQRIRRKIAWPPHQDDDMLFLQAFYTALRKRLENRLLFGHRKRDKFDLE